MGVSCRSICWHRAPTPGFEPRSWGRPPPRSTEAHASRRDDRSGVDAASAAGQYASQVPQSRKYLVVPVRPLCVVGALLALHDVLVLTENILGEPDDERPHRVNEARHRRLFHRQIAVSAVGTFLVIQWGVAHPPLPHRIISF